MLKGIGSLGSKAGLRFPRSERFRRGGLFLPGEVATPILDQRPNPVGPEERARMVQPQDCADLILYISLLPKRLTMNEVMLSPTWNRAYVAAIRQLSNL